MLPPKFQMRLMLSLTRYILTVASFLASLIIIGRKFLALGFLSVLLTTLT